MKYFQSERCDNLFFLLHNNEFHILKQKKKKKNKRCF